jgi:hypothetical protein
VFTVGAGNLDIQAALTDRSIATLNAKSSVAVYDLSSGNVYFGRDSSAVWGSNAMWGSLQVWGANAFMAAQPALDVGKQYHRWLQRTVGQQRSLGKLCAGR